MTNGRLAWRGLWGHRRSHMAVAAGVAVAAAVLVGALVVGESVRGSLRALVEQRLGRIDTLVAPGRLFRAELADESNAAPLLIVPATVSTRLDGETRRVSGVTLIGCDERFFALDSRGESAWPALEGALVGEVIASQLSAGVGDEIVLRSSIASALPADSPLGEKADTVGSVRVKIASVIPPEGLARFALTPSQATPRNVFVPLEVAQRLLEAPGECNALVAAGELTPSPRLADYGVSIEQLTPGIWQLESRELVLNDALVEATNRAWNTVPRVTANTYLANTIRRGERMIPYSTIAGADGDESLLPFEQLSNDQITLNRWAADDLQANLGDRITITLYEPESTHGELREAAPVTLEVAQIVDLLDEAGEPTRANDRRWTPRLEGVTDSRSINNWDLPFELVHEIRTEDEDYWDEYNTTPKAFVSRELADRLWGSRWGSTSLIRVAAPDATQEQLAQALLSEIDPTEMGFAPRAIRAEGLAAASGATPFDVLFLLFSMFLIAASLLLIALLVWLAVDSRRREIGVLGAVGFDRRAVRRLLLRELAPVAAIGAAAGAAIGVAYAGLLLWLLRTIWIDAIREPFLYLNYSPVTVLAGAGVAWLVAMATIVGAVRRATLERPKTLLGGEVNSSATQKTASRSPAILAASCILIALGVMAFASNLSGESAAGAYFVSGAAWLASLLLGLLAVVQRRPTSIAKRFSLGALARLNSIRRPGRALLVVGLVAAACFLLLSTSVFRLPPTKSGTGGFDLVCQSDQPLHYDLATGPGRFELGMGDQESSLLNDAQVYSFRVRRGEDASCQNLYQTSQPRMLGATERFIRAADQSPTPFVWADHAAVEGHSPWKVLISSAKQEVIPVVLDFNTAVYSLKLYGGIGERFTIQDAVGEPMTAEVAGLLKNSVLQGDLLMSEANLLRIDPNAAGYRFFLVDTAQPEEAAAVLEDQLGDYGLDAEDAQARLAGFLAVQNTYLSTFQALGGLGLLLGAVGLAIAQLRNLNERRGELALMRASGFPSSRIRSMALRENLALLAIGLLMGAFAAALTVGPLAKAGDAQPPWLTALALVVLTLLIGQAASTIAVARALSAPITESLRGE